MRSRALDALLGPVERVRRIIWVAFIASVPCDVYVAYSVAREAAFKFDPLLSHYLTVTFGTVAIAQVLAFWFVPGFLLSDRKFRDFITQDRDPETLARDPRTGQVDPARLERAMQLSAGERRQWLGANASFVPFIVQLAVAEAIALYGLVLAMVSHLWTAILPFAIVAIVLQLTISPKVDSSLERATRLAPL